MRYIVMNSPNTPQWTYGQYRIFRVLLGAWALVHFVHVFPWSQEIFSNQGVMAQGDFSPLLKWSLSVLKFNDSPMMVHILISLGILASTALIFGVKDKWASGGILYLLSCLLARNPLILNPSLPYVGWLLLLHMCMPNPTPGHLWVFPKPLKMAACVVLGISYSYSGFTKLLSPSWLSGNTIEYVLLNPLARDVVWNALLLHLPPISLKLLTWFILVVELLYFPLSLCKPLRRWLWLSMLLVQFGFLFCLNFADLTFPMLLFHLITYEPSEWTPTPSTPSLTDRLFFDGRCGLCHRFVYFVLKEDTLCRFQFIPLASPIATQSLKDQHPGEQSMVIQTPDHAIYQKSSAIIYVWYQLGGVHRLLGIALWMIPKPLRDLGYDMNAKIRHHWFKRPATHCPIVPAHLRHRFVH